MRDISFPYTIHGTVVTGLGRGTQIGFPTINLVSSENIQFSGVFFIQTVFDTTTFFGLGHIGPRPTFDDQQFQIELHLLDFPPGEHVPRTVECILLEQIRDVQKFSGVEQLVAQIKVDVEKGEEIKKKYSKYS